MERRGNTTPKVGEVYEGEFHYGVYRVIVTDVEHGELTGGTVYYDYLEKPERASNTKSSDRSLGSFINGFDKVDTYQEKIQENYNI